MKIKIEAMPIELKSLKIGEKLYVNCSKEVDSHV